MVCVLGESVLPLISAVPQRTLAEAETRLPCRYSGEDKVVQVGWSRVRANGDIEQIIIYDFTEGVKGECKSVWVCSCVCVCVCLCVWVCLLDSCHIRAIPNLL